MNLFYLIILDHLLNVRTDISVIYG